MLRSLNRSFKRINCCLNGTHLPPLIWEKSFQSIGGRMTRRMARNPPSGSGGKLRMISGWVGTCANAAMASQPETPHVPAAEKISAGSSPGGQGRLLPRSTRVGTRRRSHRARIDRSAWKPMPPSRFAGNGGGQSPPSAPFANADESAFPPRADTLWARQTAYFYR